MCWASSWALPDAAAVDDDVDAPTVRELADLVDRVDLAAIDRRVGVHGVSRHRQAPAVEIDQEDLPGSAGARQPDVEAADRPCPDHDHDVAVADPGELLTVDDAGERLRHRRFREADALRYPVEPVDRQHRAGHDHVLGEAAVVLVADRRLVRAHRHAAPTALLTRPVGHRRDHLHPIAGRPAVDVLPDLDDLTGDLVSHDPRWGHVRVPVVEDLDVRAAGGAVPHADLDLVGGRRGFLGLLEADVLRCVKACNSHERLFLSRTDDG
jgi:hypothetical protein